MFAVFKTGGKQYRVAAEDELKIEKIEAETGEIVTFKDVLMVGGAGAPLIGSPMVEGASVAAEVVDQGRDKTVIIFKKRRRQNSRRRNGHRQHYTMVRVTEILTDGKAPSKKAAPKPAAVEAEEPAAPEEEAVIEAAVEETVAEAPVSETPAEAELVETATSEEAPAEAAATEDTGDDAELAPLFDTPEGDADDLKKISGVGPVLEKKLNALGITQYAQVAAFSVDDIARVDEVLNFKGRIERENWIEQAKSLAEGAGSD
ncbi:MAG: 50S ribosomal protein L21 [Pseudomonadota bacterium]